MKGRRWFVFVDVRVLIALVLLLAHWILEAVRYV